jgi:hypothetical protein
MSYLDDFLGDDSTLKGVSGGKANKSRTPRPIKPPGVYVNGKATSKASKTDSATDDAPVPIQPRREVGSMEIEKSKLELYRQQASDGSETFQAYLSFSMGARSQLEMDIASAFELLDTAATRFSKICDEHVDVQNHPSDDDEEDGGHDLLALLEERNESLESQLTSVWDELLLKDESYKRLSKMFDDFQHETIAAHDKAAKEIARANKELSA